MSFWIISKFWNLIGYANKKWGMSKQQGSWHAVVLHSAGQDGGPISVLLTGISFDYLFLAYLVILNSKFNEYLISYMPDPPLGKKISWYFHRSYGLTAGDADFTVFENEKHFFLISGTFGSFWDVVTENRFYWWLWWVAWHVARVILLIKNFKVTFSPLCKHQLNSAPCHWLSINASLIAHFKDSWFFF